MAQSAVIDYPNTIIQNKAIAYGRYGDSFIENPNRQMECGSSNVHSTLDDMLTWASNFQLPKVGTPSQIKRLMTKTISLSEDSDLAYGLGMFTETYKGLKTSFHGGGTGGYRAYILHVPEHQFSIVTLGNQNGFDGLLIVQDLLELYLKDHIAEPIPTKTSYTAEEMKQLEGMYEFHPGQYWNITTDGKDLYLNGSDDPLPILGDDKFKYTAPTAYFSFHQDVMYFRIADFNFRCNKIDLDPPTLSQKELEQYVGTFKNTQLNTYYELLIIDDNLVAKHLTNGEITLQPLSTDSFFAPYPLGELCFQLDPEGKVNGFVLAGQNFDHIKFRKIE